MYLKDGYHTKKHTPYTYEAGQLNGMTCMYNVHDTSSVCSSQLTHSNWTKEILSNQFTISTMLFLSTLHSKYLQLCHVELFSESVHYAHHHIQLCWLLCRIMTKLCLLKHRTAGNICRGKVGGNAKLILQVWCWWCIPSVRYKHLLRAQPKQNLL